MNKKILTTLLLLGLTTTSAFAHGCPQCGENFGGPQGGPPPCGFNKPCNKPPRINLDEKLKLTDKQKEQAKQLRMQGREQMEPIMSAIRTKQEQKQLIKNSKDLTTEAKLEQVEKLNTQIDALHKQARDLRLKNERDFESILTQKQKKELDKIKSEKRKNMAKFSAKSAPKK